MRLSWLFIVGFLTLVFLAAAFYLGFWGIDSRDYTGGAVCWLIGLFGAFIFITMPKYKRETCPNKGMLARPVNQAKGKEFCFWKEPNQLESYAFFCPCCGYRNKIDSYNLDVVQSRPHP